MLLGAIQDGVSLLTWQREGFALADSFDESEGRYRGLRGGQIVSLFDPSSPALLVKGDIARKQMDEENVMTPGGPVDPAPAGGGTGPRPPGGGVVPPPAITQPKRFHGTAALNPMRVGLDASKIAEEVIAHLAGLVGATVTVTLDVEAEVPSGTPENVVRTVTENCRTLKFTSQGFEKE